MIQSELPTLYGLTSKGAVKIWNIRVTEDSFITSYGQIGGKLTTNERKVTPKNVGRSNETSCPQQAVKEARSTWQKKLDAGYCTDASRAGEDTITRRMRCCVFEEGLINTVTSYYLQPKLNGVKCFIKKVAEDAISYQSSGGKQYTALHKYFDEVLLEGMAIGEELDAEIYLHGASLEEIQSATKKENELTRYLEVWAYDVVSEGLFPHRLSYMQRVVARVNSDKVKVTPTMLRVGRKAINKYHFACVADGFEGSIIRTESGAYTQGRKNINILKRKNWKSKEFLITGYTKDVRGCIIFECAVDDNTFKVVPKGTQDARKRMYIQGEKYIGKYLTVLYSDLSANGIPQGNPTTPLENIIGENVRAEEDMDQL